MQAFYSPIERDYRPTRSFFNGDFTPYPEVPERAEALLAALRDLPGTEIVEVGAADGVEAALAAVHDGGYLATLAEVCGRLKPEEQFFPGVIQQTPQLLRTAYPRVRAGYYTVDSSTPLLPGSYAAALGAAGAALRGVAAIREGAPRAYCLLRPPGHHAGRAYWAGYCLLNHAALAADALTALGPVAVLDVDYHHGNGTQDIFYARDDVAYVSLHCDPERAYPYIAGAAEETGTGRGLGHNRNLPLPPGTDWAAYAPALESALETVAAHDPAVVVVSLGLDTLAGDPISTFALEPADFAPMARRIAQLGKPLLIVQEGGYRIDALGAALGEFLGAVEQP